MKKLEDIIYTNKLNDYFENFDFNVNNTTYELAKKNTNESNANKSLNTTKSKIMDKNDSSSQLLLDKKEFLLINNKPSSNINNINTNTNIVDKTSGKITKLKPIKK